MAIDGEASPIGSRSWKIQGKEKDKSFNPKQTAQSVPPPIGENSEEENLRIRCRNPCCGAGVCRTGGSCWSGKPLEVWLSALCRERLGEEIGRRGGGPGDRRSARSTASRATAGGPRLGGVFAAWCTEPVDGLSNGVRSTWTAFDSQTGKMAAHSSRS